MADGDDVLLSHVLAMQKQLADQSVLIATTASAVAGMRRESDARHRDTQAAIGKVRAGVAESNVTTMRIATEMKEVKAEVRIMKPVVRRMRGRELVRRGVVECLGRWRALFVAAGLTIGGLVTWLNDSWPKVAALFRKLGGVWVVVVLRAAIEAAAAEPFAPMLLRFYLAGAALACVVLLLDGGAVL
jgi:hypothetical protein